MEAPLNHQHSIWSSASLKEWASGNGKNSKKKVLIERYLDAKSIWPKCGRLVTGQYTDSAILVYQAFNRTIGQYAIENKKFEGAPGYSMTRMTWIKPNFLWMMYRSNWASSRDQDVILGLWLKREALEEILSQAILSNNKEGHKAHRSKRKENSPKVTVQWDPDHPPDGESSSPTGGKHPLRRDIQIGIKNRASWANGADILDIVDMTPFVASQAAAAKSEGGEQLWVPAERIYTLPPALVTALRITADAPTKEEDEENPSNGADED